MDHFQSVTGNSWEDSWVRDANTNLWTNTLYQTDEAGRRIRFETRNTKHECTPIALFPDLSNWRLKPFGAD